ncbi:hypothetical protein B0H14DRAFT_2568021 [Mycena olivaceomarginata]|nr:hypothetical protein B0H14DRAFT_2568021 [Mycena olivaceomarginata]
MPTAAFARPNTSPDPAAAPAVHIGHITARKPPCSTPSALQSTTAIRLSLRGFTPTARAPSPADPDIPTGLTSSVASRRGRQAERTPPAGIGAQRLEPDGPPTPSEGKVEGDRQTHQSFNGSSYSAGVRACMRGERGKGLGRSKVEEGRRKSETKNKTATWWPRVALSDPSPHLSSSLVVNHDHQSPRALERRRSGLILRNTRKITDRKSSQRQAVHSGALESAMSCYGFYGHYGQLWLGYGFPDGGTDRPRQSPGDGIIPQAVRGQKLANRHDTINSSRANPLAARALDALEPSPFRLKGSFASIWRSKIFHMPSTCSPLFYGQLLLELAIEM